MRRRVVSFCLLGVVVAVQAYAAVQRRWMQEDGFINVRIAQQVVAGNGPVFNAGQRVEAFTSPLWIAVLVVGRVLTFGQVPYEWIAVSAGVLLSAAGVALLMVGAVALWTPPRAEPDKGFWLPFGILVPLALPPFWDFATSGLETSLSTAWVGAAFAALATGVRNHERAALGRGREPRLVPRFLVIGLAPLVRPELALYGVAIGTGLLLLAARRMRGDEPRRWWWRSSVLAWWGPTVAYQVFRMGYYAAVLPNTALAKNAGTGVWERGLDYLDNFTSTYNLLLPLALLVAVVLLRPPARRDQLWVGACMVVPALLHVLYVVGIGGDYMHGRFWLPPLLALVAPVAAMPVITAHLRDERTQIAIPAGAVLVAIWAMVAAVAWRPPQLDPDGVIDDQRSLVTTFIGIDHPVRSSEQPLPLVAVGDGFRGRVGEDVYVDVTDMMKLTAVSHRRPEGAGAAVRFDAIGVTGVRAGIDVAFVDGFGLADGVAARTPPVSQVRAGHTHSLTPEWRLARARVVDSDEPGVVAARHAMECGRLATYLRGTEEPLTLGRFLSNIWNASANTTFEVPADPAEAERHFCGT